MSLQAALCVGLQGESVGVLVTSLLENVPAYRTGRLVAGAEPAVQTGAVKLLLACLASEFGQLVRVLVNHTIAYVTLLYSLKLLVQISLPQGEAVEDGAVLVA